MDYIIKIVELLEIRSIVDGATKTELLEIKKQGGFLPAMMAPTVVSLIT